MGMHFMQIARHKYPILNAVDGFEDRTFKFQDKRGKTRVRRTAILMDCLDVLDEDLVNQRLGRSWTYLITFAFRK